MANGQPRGDLSVESAEVLAHALADRLQCLGPVPRQGGVDADALAGAMVDRHDDADMTLLGGHHVRDTRLARWEFQAVAAEETKDGGGLRGAEKQPPCRDSWCWTWVLALGLDKDDVPMG